MKTKTKPKTKKRTTTRTSSKPSSAATRKPPSPAPPVERHDEAEQSSASAQDGEDSSEG